MILFMKLSLSEAIKKFNKVELSDEEKEMNILDPIFVVDDKRAKPYEQPKHTTYTDIVVIDGNIDIRSEKKQ